MAAEQVLDIVLGGREQDIHARLVHQAIQAIGVERNCGRIRSLRGGEHGADSLWACLVALSLHHGILGCHWGQSSPRKRRESGDGRNPITPPWRAA